MAQTQANNKTRFGNIIATIAIAVFLVFWTLIDRRLQDLEIRLRTVENQLIAISVRLGIEPDDKLNSSQPGTHHELQSAGGKLP